MNVIGLLVKGSGGEEYLVTTGPETTTGTGALLMFRRDASGWVPASLTKEEEALVQADTSVALYRLARQAGVVGSTSVGSQEI